MILSTFKNMVDDMGMSKIFLLPIKDKMSKVMGKMDYRKLGGGVFLGVKKPIIKAHGNSNKTAFYYTLKQAKKITKEIGLKYYINTFGCQLNENDSEKIAGMLVECGYQQAEKEADADIIVFNTCCIRENAEKTLFGVLRRS